MRVRPQQRTLEPRRTYNGLKGFGFIIAPGRCSFCILREVSVSGYVGFVGLGISIQGAWHRVEFCFECQLSS